MVADRPLVGKGLKVDISHVVFDFFGVGRGGVGGADGGRDFASSSSREPLPMIHQIPEDFAWTLMSPVFSEAVSPAWHTRRS